MVRASSERKLSNDRSSRVSAHVIRLVLAVPFRPRFCAFEEAAERARGRSTLGRARGGHTQQRVQGVKINIKRRALWHVLKPIRTRPSSCRLLGELKITHTPSRQSRLRAEARGRESKAGRYREACKEAHGRRTAIQHVQLPWPLVSVDAAAVEEEAG
eukprot:scaffold16412_cov59-Phaeocystis_antarctica.AAC.11